MERNARVSPIRSSTNDVKLTVPIYSFQGKIKLNKLVEKCMELINPKDYSASSFNQDWNSIEIQELRQKYEKGNSKAVVYEILI